MNDNAPYTPDQERRLGRLEGISEQVDNRLTDMQRIMIARFDSLDRSIQSQTRWLVSLNVATILTLIGLILGTR